MKITKLHQGEPKPRANGSNNIVNHDQLIDLVDLGSKQPSRYRFSSPTFYFLNRE